MANVPVKISRAIVVRDGARPSQGQIVEGVVLPPINQEGTNPATVPDPNKVPYVNATQNVVLGDFGVSSGFVKLDTTPTNTPTDQGTMSWDVDDNTIQVVLNGYIMKIGEDQFYPVKNQTGSSIPKGTAVRFAGTLGMSGRLLIAPFIADGSVSSSFFMGVTTETIANGADGKVLWFGRIRGINTNAFNEGDVLYASTSVAGAFQTAIPQAPNNIVQVAAVITKSSTVGTIFVRPTIGSNINKDEGVKITSPSAGQLLLRQSNGLFENKGLSLNPTAGSFGLAESGVLTFPNASSSARGLLSNVDWNTFNGKIGGTIASGQVAFGTGSGVIGGDSGLVWDNVNKIPTISNNDYKVGGLARSLVLVNDSVLTTDEFCGIAFELPISSGSRRTRGSIGAYRESLSNNSGGLEFYTRPISGDLVSRWRITSSGILQSNGAQTIQTSTGNLTLATAAGNGNIILSPHRTEGVGRVGIGTSTPNYQLDVGTVGRNSTGEVLFTAGNSTSSDYTQTTLLRLRATSINANRVSHDGTASVAEIRLNHANEPGQNSSGSIAFYTNPSNFNTALQERVTINKLGNVGIGTNTPFDTGSDYGDLSINGTNGGILSFLDDNVQKGFIGNIVDEVRLTTRSTTGYLTFRTGLGNSALTEAMRIIPSGNVGIRTPSPTNTLDVNGTTRIRLISNATGNFLTTSATGVIQQRTAAETRGDIGAIGGTIASGQVAFGTGSGVIGGSGNLTWDNSVNSLGIGGFSQVNSIVTINSTIAPGVQRNALSFTPNRWFNIYPVSGVFRFAAFIEGDALENVSRYTHPTLGGHYLNFSLNRLDFVGTSASTGIGDVVTGEFVMMRLNYSTQNVGIGTTAPTNTLDINGRTRIRTIDNATGNFLTRSATGVIQQRTPAETRTDIGAIGGSGTVNRLSKFITANTIGDSRLIDNGVSAWFVNQNTNTFFGEGAGLSSDLGNRNQIAFGRDAGRSNVTGNNWTAIGRDAGRSNTTGFSWTAIGFQAARNNTVGIDWTAIGLNAGFSNTTGSFWTAIGINAGFNNTNGNSWTAIGVEAGKRRVGGENDANYSNSVFIGADTRSGEQNATNQIVIGHNALGEGSNSTVIGNASTLLTRLYGELRVGTIDNAIGNFVTTSATGVIQQRTPTETRTDIGAIGGSGTFNRLALFTASGAIGNSRLVDNGVSAWFVNQNTNTFFGEGAGLSSDLGNRNQTAFGRNAGSSNTTGLNWTAIGVNAGLNNTTGGFWTAIGRNAGFNNTTGSSWIAIGFQAAINNTTGSFWTAIGRDAGRNNTTGTSWTAIGVDAGRNNTTGSFWTAIGRDAGRNNTTGTSWTAIGVNAGLNNTTGGSWIAIGLNAGKRRVGGEEDANYSNSVFIGADTRSGEQNATNQIVIGHGAFGEGSDTTVIGNNNTIKTRLRGTLNLTDLPTSSTGLVAGDIWNDNGTLKIV